MKKFSLFLIISVFYIGLSSFTKHKFYVAIHELQYAPEKKRIEITSRIFLDDLNAAIETQYHQKLTLGEKNESAKDVELLQKYLLSHFAIYINAQSQKMELVRHEYANNIILCYFKVLAPTKPKTIIIEQTAMLDLFPEQQHIINANVAGSKRSLLLTNHSPKGTLNF